jgi:predicted RNA-binding protein associated with RNAse of E/G family
MGILIYWNHVGREHGGLKYTDDIRKNDEVTIKSALELKEKQCRTGSNIFIQYDENTLIELSPLDSERRYIIIYCIDRGLQFFLIYKTKYPWWLVDIVDVKEVKPNVFCVNDLFIDISVNINDSYKVMDIDDYEIAFSLGVMTKTQVINSLKSFHSILDELNSKQFPNNLLIQIKEQYLGSI